jgi:hypothetical protein
MKTTTLPSRMRGISFLGWMLILIVAVVFISAGVKIVPAFLDFNTIRGIISSVLQDPKAALKTDTELLSDVGKRFSINNVTAIGVDDVVISRESSRLTMSVSYEVRGNLFKNIDLVMSFDEDFVKDIRQ